MKKILTLEEVLSSISELTTLLIIRESLFRAESRHTTVRNEAWRIF